MRTIAVILAGGTGKRVGGDVPKQLLRLPDGRTVLERCVDAFWQCEEVDEIVVVMHPDWLKEVPEGVQVVAGGKERWESSWKAIAALSERGEEVNVLLHDGARPFVSREIVHAVCEALETNQAVTVAVPVTETLYVVEGRRTKDDVRRTMYEVRCTKDKEGCTKEDVRCTKDEGQEVRVESIPNRSEYMRAQTPQAFRLSLIRKAYELAMRDEEGIVATDDCGIVKKYLPEEPIVVVEGEEKNRKITFREDL